MGKRVKVSKQKPHRRAFYSVGDRFERPGYGFSLLCQIDYRKAKLIMLLNGNRYSDVIVQCPSNLVDQDDFYAAWGPWKKIS